MCVSRMYGIVTAAMGWRESSPNERAADRVAILHSAIRRLCYYTLVRGLLQRLLFVC
jgi:hypothetical protein